MPSHHIAVQCVQLGASWCESRRRGPQWLQNSLLACALVLCQPEADFWKSSGMKESRALSSGCVVENEKSHLRGREACVAGGVARLGEHASASRASGSAICMVAFSGGAGGSPRVLRRRWGALGSADAATEASPLRSVASFPCCNGLHNVSVCNAVIQHAKLTDSQEQQEHMLELQSRHKTALHEIAGGCGKASEHISANTQNALSETGLPVPAKPGHGKAISAVMLALVCSQRCCPSYPCCFSSECPRSGRACAALDIPV